MDILIQAPDFAEDNWWPQQQLAARVPAFLAHHSQAGSDFQIGVLHQCIFPDCQGGLSRSPADPDRILRPTTIGLEEQLVLRLAGDYPPPRGFYPQYYLYAWLTLTPPLLTGPNAGFARPDTRFVFVWISPFMDTYVIEPRESPPEASPHAEIGQLAKFMSTVSGGTPKLSSVFLTTLRNVVDAPPYYCRSNPTPFAHIAVPPRIFSAATADSYTGEVCPADESEFDEIVERMAEVTSGLHTHFALPTQPDFGAGPIEVVIDGAPTPALNAQGEIVWEYQSGANAVHFPVAKTPRPGQKVLLRYHAQAP
ncbi:MAG: hypothetical protein QM765_28375 [Myxococcales bacterium]